MKKTSHERAEMRCWQERQSTTSHGVKSKRAEDRGLREVKGGYKNQENESYTAYPQRSK